MHTINDWELPCFDLFHLRNTQKSTVWCLLKEEKLDMKCQMQISSFYLTVVQNVKNKLLCKISAVNYILN